jgi:hypothetical protein
MKREENNTSAAPSPGAHRAAGIADLQRAGEGNNSPAPVSSAKTKSISQRKLEANRANAKKSTGPRTARGKAFSRRNAVRHNLSSVRVLFQPDRTPCDPELGRIWQSLHETFGAGDATTDALIERAVAELAHQVEAVKMERACSEMPTPFRHRDDELASFLRYVTKSRRALLRTLSILRASCVYEFLGGALFFAKRSQEVLCFQQTSAVKTTDTDFALLP